MTISDISVSLTRAKEPPVEDMLFLKVQIMTQGNVFHYVRYLYESDVESNFDLMMKLATETLRERLLNPGEPDFITNGKVPVA